MSQVVLEALKAKFGDAILETHSAFGDDTAGAQIELKIEGRLIRAEATRTDRRQLRGRTPFVPGALQPGLEACAEIDAESTDIAKDVVADLPGHVHAFAFWANDWHQCTRWRS